MDSEDTTVGWLTADGRIQLMDCEVCPWRQQLCDTCIVPTLLAGGSAGTCLLDTSPNER